MKLLNNIGIEKRNYTQKLLRENTNTIFVFGDNAMRYGKKGQAVIRDEPNAFGIATKVKPSMRAESFFNDNLEEHRQIVLSDLRKLYSLAKRNPNIEIVFPFNGIGTGLSQMPERCPKIFHEINNIIEVHFKITFPYSDTKRNNSCESPALEQMFR